MKKALLIIMLLCGVHARAEFIPTYTSRWEIVRSDREWERVEWFQADTVRRHYQFILDGSPAALTNASHVTWRVFSNSEPILTYISMTGTIVNAAAAEVFFQLAPSNSNLQVGRYRGYVVSWKVDGTNVVEDKLLVRQAIQVQFSDDSQGYPFVGPQTWTDSVQLPESWPAGWPLVSYDGGQTTTARNPADFGGGAGITGLTSNDFADTATVTWTRTGGVMRATAQSSGTLLKKSGISLTGTYQIGPGLSVDGDVIDASIDASAYMPTPLGDATTGRAPVHLPSPYDTAVWRDVASFESLPASGDPQVVWFNPATGGFFFSQPYAYYQGPMSTNNISIGTNVAIFAEIGTNTFVVPPGVTMLQVKGWGQAGHNSATASRGGYGGHVQGYLPVTAGESLTLIIAGSLPGMSHMAGGIPNGGSAQNNNGGGGGSSILFRGTNLLAVAAGGGGTYVAGFGGDAGGLVGGNGSISGQGVGGSQSVGGYLAGGYLTGGHGTGNAGGGGGGYYGGGGAVNSGGTGGGGSSYIGGLLFAFTVTGPFSVDSDYQAGWAQRSASTMSPGGQGGWVTRW